jgi:hypothetical protein
LQAWYQFHQEGAAPPPTPYGEEIRITRAHSQHPQEAIMRTGRLSRAGIALAALLLLPASARPATLSCSSAATLEALVTCIRAQMPASGSNGFVAPTAEQLAGWRTAVREMLQGGCSGTLPSGVAGIAQRRTFVDADNGKTYCVLMEVLDTNSNGIVDRGWGTFIVDANASREISHQAPHPISDSTTEVQAVGVFKGTDSRSFLMAGAHRNASPASSTCQSAYRASDVAHNAATMFQAANEEMLVFYGAFAWWAIQWHGMAADTCSTVEVYISHGSVEAPAAGDKNLELKTAALVYHPAWMVAVPGTGACGLNATDNVQGRLLNGVTAGEVCDTAASGYSGAFLHIEQDPNFRSAANWVPAVLDTWPVGAPPAPTALKAVAGNAQVSLSWTGSAGATSYTVSRGTSSGGTYTPIAFGITGTAYTDATVTNGTTYFYVVFAENESGESAFSNEASATPQVPQVPEAPTNLTATAGRKQIALAWTAAPGAASYTVRRATRAGGPYTSVATGVKSTSYTNTGLKSGTKYYYVVVGVNASGTSLPSNEASATAR